MKIHTMLANDSSLELKADYHRMNKKAHRLLTEGRANIQECYRQLCERGIGLGCIALILNESDDVAQEHFREAARYALEWLGAPGSVGGPRLFEVDLQVSPSGLEGASVRERPQPREPSKLSVIGYTDILVTTVAFGNRDGMRTVAEFPEAGYQNPDVVAAPDFFAFLRAWKAWLLGREPEARKEATASLKGTKEEAGRAGLAAFLALIARNQRDFEAHLAERLKGHKKQYQKLPNDPAGIMCLDGMALCRMALDQGLIVKDGPYVPARLLPNHKTASS